MSRQVPSNIEAEQALLGAILVNNQAFDRVAGFLQPETFFDPFHSHLYKVIGDCIRAGKQANPITIKPALPDGNISGMSPFEYVIRLSSNAVTVVSARDFGLAVYDAWERRRVITSCEKLIDDSFSLDLSVSGSKIAAEGIEQLGRIVAESPKDDSPNSAASVVDHLFAMASDDSVIRQIKWPLRAIHEVANGALYAGQLTGILSSSGEGKTSLVLQIVHYAAANDSPVLLLSYDQSGTECAIQIATQQLGIEGSRIRQKKLMEREYERYFEFLQGYKKLPIVVQKCTTDGVEQIRTSVRQFIRRYASKHTGVPLIVLDHVRKVTPRDPKAHEGRIASEINGALKSIAFEHDCAMVALNQRNSQGMKRPNPRPIGADMFGGEMAKEDYDTILYLYRPDKYMDEQLKTAADSKEEDRIKARFAGWEGFAEIGALKVRFGNPSYRRKIRFEAEFTRYTDIREEAPRLIEDAF